MKNLCAIIFLFIANYLTAQTIQSDLALLRTQPISSSSSVKEKTSTSSLVALPGEFYHNNISGQWGHTCYFEIPCSDFSHQLIRHYGIVKGFFLTIDRHGKCNKLSFFETLPNRINAKGKIIDSVNFYH